jgi:glycosyltransferase involved in cell wall biosynthesis
MNVLVIGRGLPDETYPLNGVFEFDQAKALEKNGVQVTFLAADLRSIRRKRKLGICSGVTDGVVWHVFNIPLGAVPKRIQHAVMTWALKVLYRRFITGHTPDVIHAHFPGPAYSAVALSEMEHIPLVVTEHSSKLNKPDVKAELLQEAHYAYSKATAVIAVGKGLAQRIEQRTGIHCVVIPNVMGETLFYQTVKQPHQGEFRFVYTGNLLERKRPVLLVEAFSQVAKAHPQARLSIIGDGSLKEELETKIRDLQLQNLVTMHGRLPRHKIADVYGQCDCFVLPSENETFGVVYIEALAAGLPVIATACGGPEDFVTPELGIVIPVDDRPALVDAMNTMVETAGQYDSKKLSAAVYKKFSDQAVASKLLQVYASVLK